ncbi:MAG: YitT family protein [Lachnospiraceae bacterium]|nr:YitT family protein [Lachnospiraceae bacterium]
MANYIVIAVGVGLMAVGVRFIYEPLNMVTGGVSGFAIIVKRFTGGIVEGGLPIWITTGVVNIPLFIKGWHVKGRGYILRSLYATVLFTVLLSVIPSVNVAEKDYFLSAVCGGVVTGAGLGLVILTFSSTGGTDLLGAIIKKYLPHYSMAGLIFIIDSVLVVLGAAVFGIRNAAYAIVAVFITSQVMDFVVNGPNNSKMLLVITGKENEISQGIFQNIKRGITSVDVKGMYSGDKKKMLICAVSKKQSARALRIIHEIDAGAFVMITDSREILGEGFVQPDSYFK